MRNEIISIAMNIILTELPVFPGSSKFGASSLSRRHSWAYIELYFGSSRAFSKTLKFKRRISAHFTFTWINIHRGMWGQRCYFKIIKDLSFCDFWLNLRMNKDNIIIVTSQMKAAEQYFPVVLFIMLYKVVLTFESVDEILWCYHSNETSSAVLSHGTIYLVCSSNFWVCGRNPMVWPFKWKLLSSTFLWYCLLCYTRWF